MAFPIDLYVSGSVLAVNGTSPFARMEVNVPLTASQLSIASISLTSGTVAGDLVVNGTLIANEFKTTVVSSSIIYRSGSTKQGDSADDIHEVTGSMFVVGGAISGSLTGSVFANNALSGSLQRLTTGQTYLAGGVGITVTTQSNGQVTPAINDNVVATLSGSRFTGPLVATDGFSGSLQQTSAGLSYLVAGQNISIVTQSNGQIVVTNTFVVTASWADVSASYLTLGPTGSLPNERVLSVSGTSGLILTDNGVGQNLGLSINDNQVATISGSRFTGAVVAAGGLSGSLQRLSTGETYLAAGTGIAITTQSNGQVLVSNTFAVTASWADVSASYVTLGGTGSLPNERVLSASFGLLMVDNGAGSTIALSVNDNEVATLTGSTFRGPVVAPLGLTGSLQEVSLGVPYLQAGNGITLQTQSNGSILVTAASGGIAGFGGFTVPNNTKFIFFSGTVGAVNVDLSDHPLPFQEHIFKDADGQSPTFPIGITASLGMTIDGASFTDITSSYGVRGIVFVGNNLWSIIQR
jgi:hypothetical protein